MDAKVTTGFLLAVILPSPTAPAQEDAEAIRLCTEVISQAHSKLVGQDVGLICQATTHGLGLHKKNGSIRVNNSVPP